MSKTFPKFFALCLITFSLLASCNPAAVTDPPSSESLDNPFNATATDLEPSATASPSPTPTPTPLPLNGQQTTYHIDITIDYYNRFISAKSRSVYTNKTDVPIEEMVFIVYPTIFDAFYLRSIAKGDGTPVSNFRWESHRLIIPLETPLLPDEQIEFVHDFELYMPDRPGIFGQTGRQLILSYWYPTIPHYDESEGWLTYEFSMVNSLFVGEYQTFEAADFNVNLQFTDRQENMEVATGAILAENDGILSYHLPLARTFVFAISDVYTILEQVNQNTTIKAYAFPENIDTAQAALEIANNALTLFDEIYGPYPREVLSVVQADLDINMEFDGIFLIQSSFYWLYNNPPKTDLTIIVPHETSHQWFFSQVGNNQAIEPWLDEALATYSEALYYERYHPDYLEWWWNARVNDHLPSGTIDTTIYLTGGVPEYFDRVYRRGALFMQDLRDTIGDEAFFNFLQAYVSEHRYDIATSENFWTVLQQYTEADLNLLFTEYFSEPPVTP